MKRIKNPFVYSSPVIGNDFFNREKIISNIFNETVLNKAQGNVWVTGERQVGKTSLLKNLYNTYKKVVPSEIDLYSTDKSYVPVFAFANVQFCQTEDDFFNELWQSLKNELDFKEYVPKIPETNFLNALKNVYSKGFYIVFLIDEFDAFLEAVMTSDPTKAGNFINKFNSFLANFPKIGRKIFSCVFSSNQELLDLTQKFDVKITGSGLIAQTYSLEWFSKKQVILLSKHYLQKSTVLFSDKEIDTLYKYTNGYPYFTQRLLYLMFRQKTETENKEIDKQIIKQFAKEEYEKTINYWTGQNMPKRTYEKLNNMFVKVGESFFDTALKILLEYSKKHI